MPGLKTLLAEIGKIADHYVDDDVFLSATHFKDAFSALGNETDEPNVRRSEIQRSSGRGPVAERLGGT